MNRPVGRKSSTRSPTAQPVVGKNGHRLATMDFDGLHSRNGYRAATAYFQSKLANLLFSHQQRVAASA